jgi:hypothetical protein
MCEVHDASQLGCFLKHEDTSSIHSGMRAFGEHANA